MYIPEKLLHHVFNIIYFILNGSYFLSDLKTEFLAWSL